MERDLKLKAKERLVVLQQRVDRDAEVIARLLEERDELRRVEERLRSERNTTREGHDQAIWERDEAHRVEKSLLADLGTVVT